MDKISKYFYLHEFFPKNTYESYSEDFLKRLLTSSLVQLADQIRNHFDSPMWINNWYFGGTLQLRGYRPKNTTIGAKYSQHKYGRAIDFNIKGISPDEIRDEIVRNSDKFMSTGLTTLEHGDFAPTWVHADIRFTGLDNILIVKP